MAVPFQNSDLYYIYLVASGLGAAPLGYYWENSDLEQIYDALVAGSGGSSGNDGDVQLSDGLGGFKAAADLLNYDDSNHRFKVGGTAGNSRLNVSGNASGIATFFNTGGVQRFNFSDGGVFTATSFGQFGSAHVIVGNGLDIIYLSSSSNGKLAYDSANQWSLQNVTKFRIPTSVEATANYGLFNLGDGGFSGGLNHFAGSANGTVHAMNITTTADFINAQVNGAQRFLVDNSGNAVGAGYADFLMYKAGGVAGVNFSGVITNLTVVGGIITAAS